MLDWHSTPAKYLLDGRKVVFRRVVQRVLDAEI